MSDFITTSQFDEMIRQSYGVPPIRADFVNRLQSELTQKAAQKPGKTFHFLRAQPVWTFAAILVTLMIIATLVIGPQKVYAAVARLLGYIPGVGVVEQSADIRVLAEPVTVTRDDISVTVTSAVLTAKSTHIEFRIFGVPRSAYPNQENIMGCILRPYLRLSDGTQLEQLNDFPPVPATENEAVFVMPCIFDTLPGTVPENWELALQFVAAPPDFTVIPVVESLPTHTPTALANTAEPAASALSITKVLEVGDKFVLMGEFNYRAPYGDSLPPDAWWAISQIAITGADGRAVPQSYSNDFDYPSPSQSGVEGWLYQLEKNFVPPVTITYSGQIITPQEPIEQAGFEFDAGLNPQNGNHWEINQDFNLGGYNIRLLSIDSNERGYTFNFQADPGASAHLIQVEIADFQPNCGGGGDGNQFQLEFSRSVCYAAMPGGPEFPHGVLKVLVHFQPLLREDKTFQLLWTPDMAQNGTYATSTPQPGVCASTALPAQLQPLPAEQANGKVLLYEKLPGTGDWSLVLYTLNGGQTQRQVVVFAGN